MTCYGQRDDETEEECNARRAREAEEALRERNERVRASPPFKLLLSAAAKGNGNTLTTLLLVRDLKAFMYDVADALDLLMEDIAK